MPTKPKTVDFYHLTTGKQGHIEYLAEKFRETFEMFENGHANEVDTVKIGTNSFYICAMDRFYPDEDDYFVWEFDVSRLDPTQQIIVGDLDDANVQTRNQALDQGENEGPVVDTEFFFDPFRNVLGTTRISGGTGTSFLKKFLSRLCNVRGLVFEIIPDEIALQNLDLLTAASTIHYSIAGMENFDELEDFGRDELGDILYAKSVGTEQMDVTLTATTLNLDRITEKAQFLFHHTEDLKVKKLEVDGSEDGQTTTIDLIQHKLQYKGDVEYDHEITRQNMFGFIRIAYNQQYNYLRHLFQLHAE